MLDEIKTRRSMRYTQRVQQALRYFDEINLSLNDVLVVDFDKPDAVAQAFMAATESENVIDLTALMAKMEDRRLVELNRFSSACRIHPTSSAWEIIDQLAEQPTTGTQVFVAMWFSESTDTAYSDGLYKAIYDSGYEPLRIDQKQHNNKIDDEIIAEIRRSRFVVADFTCAPGNVRGGVYFEAGLAMGLTIPVIWTCKDSSINDLHFDTRQYAHIVWTSPDDLYKQLKARIGATIGDGPLRR